MNDRDAVGAYDLAQRFPHGPNQRGLRFLVTSIEGRADQMGEHLGVRLGVKNMALLFKLRPKRKVVFDDAVMDQHQAPALVKMGVGVLVGHAAMGRPTGMADAQIPVRGTCRNDFRKVGDPSDGLPHFEASSVKSGDARRIIAAIFETTQTIEQDRNGVCPADITNDAAHRILNRDNSLGGGQDANPTYE